MHAFSTGNSVGIAAIAIAIVMAVAVVGVVSVVYWKRHTVSCTSVAHKCVYNICVSMHV